MSNKRNLGSVLVGMKTKDGERGMKKFKDNIGIVYCVVFYIIFYALAILLKPYLDGAQWYMESSIQRFVFGVLELFIFVKLYKKDSWKNVINFRNSKKALAAGTGIIILIIFYAIYLAIGMKSFIDTTFSIVIWCLFFQQLTTGFWEELTLRAFVLEGYFAVENRTWKTRLGYACLSFVLFGLVHAVECDSFSFALYRFILTGIMGFAFASIYLYSHNILIPMLLHFIYDIFANTPVFVEEWNQGTLFTIMDNYIYFAIMGIVLVVAIVFVVKGEKENGN